MPGLDEALERLITDRTFREALVQDPQGALAEYELSDDDRALLAAHLDTGAGASGSLEQRTSKSSTFAALGAVAEALGPTEVATPTNAAGGRDETASSWIRVAQPPSDPAEAAASGTKTHEPASIPRIGDETIVEFLDGGITPPEAGVGEEILTDEAGRVKVQFPSDSGDGGDLATGGLDPQAAETVHPFLKANGSDIQGESS